MKITIQDAKEQFIAGFLGVLEANGMAIDEFSTNRLLAVAIAEGISRIFDPQVLNIEVKTIILDTHVEIDKSEI